MTHYADTSFVASLYLQDRHSRPADRIVRSLVTSLPLTRLGEFELTNAARAAVFCAAMTVGQSEATLVAMRQDLTNGRFVRIYCNWETVFRVARTLSQRHTSMDGYRALDILHVAIAVVLRCTRFLIFDQRQARLAQKAGLQTLP